MLELTVQKLQSIALSRISTPVILAAGILLTGCMTMQTTLTLYGDEQWSGVQAVQLSPEFVEMMEQGDTSTTETTESGGTITTETSVDTEGFDEWLENAQNLSDSDDFEVTFDEISGDDGSQGFMLQATGQRYEAMNQIFFSGQADISTEMVDGQRQITIRYDFSEASEGTSEPAAEMSPEEMAMQQQMLAAFGLSISFRISGGEIISSNATRVEGGTAIWETPTLVEVTLTEAAELSPDTLALQEPPAGSGFSVQAFESMMDGFIEELESSVDSELSSSEATTEEVEVETETAPATASDTIAGAAGAEPETTTTESSAEATESTTDAAEAEAKTATTDPATEITEADAAAAPAEEERALPASGAILPERTSPALSILAGLVLATLVGAGAAGSLLKQK
jgi:hypothetical protein